jgi:predicted membrane GTPase involved in stress response
VLRSEGTNLLKYKIPTRGLLGLRNAILTASRGTAILNTIFDSYGPWAGDIITRDQGSLVITNFQDCLEIRLLNINYSLYFG